MKETLKRLSKITAPACVTVIVKTHKTHPENQQDSIALKNGITEAKNRLEREFGKDLANKYGTKLDKIANEIDHNYNDNGLILFVNDDVAEYLRLPTNVTPRVIIDDTFATRSIIRSLKRDTDYYLLALARGKARLIHVSGESVVEEIKTEGFPLEDKSLFLMSKEEAAQGGRVTNLTQEFFNRVDKAVNKVRANEPHSVLIYSEETNFHNYQKVADYPNTILGHITLKNFDESASNLAKEVWNEVKQIAIDRDRARVSELSQAINAGTYLGDLNEIWMAVQEGKGKTIFVEEGYYQAVKEEENGTLSPIAYEDINSKEHIDDIVDEMIEHCLKYGGGVVFLEKGSMKDFNGVALVTRY